MPLGGCLSDKRARRRVGIAREGMCFPLHPPSFLHNLLRLFLGSFLMYFVSVVIVSTTNKHTHQERRFQASSVLPFVVSLLREILLVNKGGKQTLVFPSSWRCSVASGSSRIRERATLPGDSGISLRCSLSSLPKPLALLVNGVSILWTLVSLSKGLPMTTRLDAAFIREGNKVGRL